MQSAPLRLPVLCLTLSVLLSACNKREAPAPSTAPASSAQTASQPAAPQSLPDGVYDPISRVSETWGAFRISGSQAGFAAFEGQMDLQYVGVMPPTAGPDLAGAHVYQIRNAGDYFMRNRGKNAFCSEAPRWLAIGSRANTAGTSDDLWVALMTLEDWPSYAPDIQGYCGGGLYAPTNGG